MKDLTYIEWQQDGPVATVWLNRPPVNATDQQLYSEIREFFSHTVDYIPHARVAVLAGRGKHFCAGNDLADFQTMDPDNAPERLKLAREAFGDLRLAAPGHRSSPRCRGRIRTRDRGLMRPGHRGRGRTIRDTRGQRRRVGRRKTPLAAGTSRCGAADALHRRPLPG